MRILMIHNLPPWEARAGGGQRVQHELATHAADLGHDVRALYLGTGEGAPATPYATAWVRRRDRLALDALAVARAVRSSLGSWCPDVVHGSAAEAGWVPFVLPPGVGVVGTSHHPDPPRVPHDLPSLAPTALGRMRALQNPLLEATLLRRAHRVVAVSRWGAETLRSRGYLPPTRPIAVVPNGVGEEWFAPPPPSARPHPTFLCVGRVEPAKGWDIVLEALARNADLADARVAFAGTGPDDGALERRIGELGLGERAERLGRLDPSTLRERLGASTALVLPSRRENYPLVLLEAMAMGIPVVAAAVGGVPELLENGRNGLLVAPDDPSALGAALLRLRRDSALRDRLREAGRLAAERHRWRTVATRMVAEYELARALARPVPRPARSPASARFRAGAARVAAARAPRAAPSPPPLEVERIALLRPGRLGDLLLADPLVAALEERHPRARIEILTDASDRVPPWMTGGKVTHRPLPLRSGADAWRRPGDPTRAAALAELAREWRTAPPQLLLLALDLTDPVYRELGAALVAAAPGAWRAGLTRGRSRLPELSATVSEGPEASHEIERLLALGGVAGASTVFRLPRIPTVESTLPAWSGATLAIHPGASRPTKQWPLARWGDLVRRLSAEGFRIVVVGAPEDRALVPGLGIAFDGRTTLDRVGELDLRQLVGAIASADAFVGNDSFPFHLAVATGIPSVVLVGPGAERWSRYPVEHAIVAREPVICSPRFGEECPVYTTCPHGACMASISVSGVADALRTALAVAPR